MGQKGTGLSDLPDFVHERTTLFNKTSFSKDAVLEYVQNPGEKHDKKKINVEVLPQNGDKW